jgi:hypothetical protein
MLGLWEVGMGPQRMNLHVAFSGDLSCSRPNSDQYRHTSVH